MYKTLMQIQNEVAKEFGEEHLYIQIESECQVGDFKMAEFIFDKVRDEFINQYKNHEKLKENSMITIFATFKGSNGSLGYTTGVEYKLTFQQNVKSSTVKINRQDGKGGDCEYSNTINFLENWTNIKS